LIAMQRRAAFIGLLTIVALLGACGGDNDKPTTLPSASEPETSVPTAATASSTSATPAPGASTPGVIQEGEAVALAKQYFEVMTEVAHDGSGFERFEQLTHPTCMPCKQQADRLRMLTDGGKRVVGGDVQVLETITDSLMGRTALIRVATKALPGTVVDRSGDVVDELPEEDVVDQVLTIAITPEGTRVVDILDLGPRLR
jgi:hypothetical protein